MEKVSFENQGTSTYLVCDLTGEKIDTMSLGMLTNNKIPGFAPAFYTQQDEKMLIKYNVSSQIALRQFFSGAVNKKRLTGAFLSIVTALNSAEEYMLDLNSVVLDLNYIFADVTSCSAKLICVPVLDLPEREFEYGMFFKRIMFSTQFDQTEDCGYVTQIINYLNGTGAFSVEEFGRLLLDLENMTRPLAKQEEASGENGRRGETMLLRETGMQKELPSPPVANMPVANMPVANVPIANMPETASAGESGAKEAEKNISFFSLMKHYSKENASEYKAQKAAKKQAEKEEKEKKKQEKKLLKQEKKEKKAKPKKNAAQPKGMAVPQGAQPKGMAVPAPSAAQPQGAAEPLIKPLAAPPIAPVAQSAVSPVLPPPQTAMPYSGFSSGGGSPANFGETTVLSSPSAGETTVLTAGMQQEDALQPYLFRQKNGEKIAINRPVFRIGKEPSFVDYLISDNGAVSRSHANFIIRDGMCYVADTNSTNHTYVNGVMIPSNVETALKDGDLVRLANEEFQFRIV